MTLRYAGPGLFRRKAHLGWVNLPMRARELGWSGKTPLHYMDSDGTLIGGFVP
jgi:hypothetical protein